MKLTLPIFSRIIYVLIIMSIGQTPWYFIVDIKLNITNVIILCSAIVMAAECASACLSLMLEYLSTEHVQWSCFQRTRSSKIYFHPKLHLLVVCCLLQDYNSVIFVAIRDNYSVWCWPTQDSNMLVWTVLLTQIKPQISRLRLVHYIVRYSGIIHV